MTDGTMTDEVRIKELEDALGTETDRLQKLFAAYETQEKELVDARAEIEVLEKEIIDREIEKESLESIIAEKDVRLRELERKATTSLKRVEHLEPELEKMEEKYTREKDRLGKVFSIAEELDNDLRLAVAEMSARDTWYMDHMALFEDLNKAIKARYDMIERAVEAERKSQHLRRAFTERVEELVEARAGEGATEDEQSEDVEEEAPSEDEVSSEEAGTEDASEDNASDEEALEDEPSETATSATWSDGEDPWES
ncbi:MAG: hypothetical protein VW230_02255 [Candidatus Poseidoniales archaeon]